MSHQQLRIRFSALVMLLAFTWHIFFFSATAVAATVSVPVGTAVLVVFNEAVDPAMAVPGQTVTLSVVNPVVIDGATVIKAGAPVLAEVTAAEKRGVVGKPAKIGVTLHYATAVDGTNIPLNGLKQVEGENKQTTSLVVTILCCGFGLLMKGGTATIPAGSQIQATTMAPVTIAVPD